MLLQIDCTQDDSQWEIDMNMTRQTDFHCSVQNVPTFQKHPSVHHQNVLSSNCISGAQRILNHRRLPVFLRGPLYFICASVNLDKLILFHKPRRRPAALAPSTSQLLTDSYKLPPELLSFPVSYAVRKHARNVRAR